MASGGMITLMRDPSASRASTIGEDSSTRRPTADTILSMMCIRCALSLNMILVSSRTPARSTYTSLYPLTRMSLMVGSCNSGSSGPNPKTSFKTSRDRRSFSGPLMGVLRSETRS